MQGTSLLDTVRDGAAFDAVELSNRVHTIHVTGPSGSEYSSAPVTTRKFTLDLSAAATASLGDGEAAAAAVKACDDLTRKCFRGEQTLEVTTLLRVRARRRMQWLAHRQWIVRMRMKALYILSSSNPARAAGAQVHLCT
jgi:hypothetical protein